MKRNSLVLLVLGILVLGAIALMSSCLNPAEPSVAYYGGSDPKGDFVEIQIDHDGGKVRRINHTTSEDSGWLSYTPETAMANGFSILYRVVINPTHFVLFAEFPQAACIYQAFDNSGPSPVTEGHPMYAVYREQVATSTYYDKAYNWMSFKINDLGSSDMTSGFAGFDVSSTQGLLYGAGYSHRRELSGRPDGGVEDINTGDFLKVDAFTYDPRLVSNIMWSGGHTGDMGYAMVLTGTASGTNIIDQGISAGGGMNIVFPQPTSASFSSTYAGTYFAMRYELNGQTNATLIEPLKIVVTSGGNVQAYNWALDTLLFDKPLVDVSSFTGGPLSPGETISQTYARVADNSSATSATVKGAHLCKGVFIAQDAATDTVVAVIFDPSGKFLGFTMFKALTPDITPENDFEIRFGVAIKDPEYATP